MIMMEWAYLDESLIRDWVIWNMAWRLRVVAWTNTHEPLLNQHDQLPFLLIKDLDFALIWNMITYLSNKINQVPSLHEVRVNLQVKQRETLGLRYNTQGGHACDFMTKCNGHAWHDWCVHMMYVKRRNRKGKFWGMKMVPQMQKGVELG